MVMIDKDLDGRHQLGDATKHPPADAFGGAVLKEVFHEIEPGAPGGHEVQVKPLVAPEPLLDLGMFVGGLVVEDERQSLVLRRLPI